MLMENILKDLASKRTPVRIYTTNGYQMHGTIIQSDDSAVLLVSDGTRKLINVSAISTVEIPNQ